MRFAGMALDGSNYVTAAQGANSGFQDILSKTRPDHAGLANLSLRNDAKDRIAAINAMASLQNASINSVVDAQMGKYNAEATKARGDANAAGSMSAGIGSMASGLAGGLGELFKSRRVKGAEGIGKASTVGFGNYPTYNENQFLSGANSIGLTY